MLLEFGADLNKLDSFNNNAAHYAAMFGQQQMLLWLWGNGVEINHSNIHNESPLHFACRSGSIEMIQFLLSNGLDATQMTDEERTPIFYAAESGRLEVVQYLVKNGCDVHHLDKRSTSILHIATHLGNFELVRYLIEQKMNLNTENIFNEKFKKNFFFNFVCFYNDRVFFFKKINEIPIFIAAHKNYANIVYLLLNNGADALVQDEKQYSLLEYAVIMGSCKLCSLLLDLKVTFQLDKAFLLSALYGKYDIFQLFLENNADTAVVSDVSNCSSFE